MTTPLSFNEAHRVALLHACNAVGAHEHPTFERAVRVAQSMFDTPIALVTLLDETWQHFAAARGLSRGGTPREEAVCNVTILSDKVFVVEDLSRDARFARNPLVHGEMGLRFYAGAPLVTREGFRLGALCVLDTKPRPRPSDDRLEALRDLAEMTAAALDGEGDMRAREDAAAESKRQFLALVSHELRTPLNAIIGFSELLTDRLDEDAPRSYADQIREAGGHMLHLVERTLDFDRMERGELEMVEDRVALKPTIERAFAAARAFADGAGASLQIDGEAADGVVKADPLHLHQVMIELFRNALAAGARQVQIVLQEGGGGDLRLRLSDDGPGAPETDRAALFEPFSVPDDVFSRRGGGLGLGLALCRRLLALHGGSIRLADEAPGGFALDLTLPGARRLF